MSSSSDLQSSPEHVVAKRARISQWPAVPMTRAFEAIDRIADKFPPESKGYPTVALTNGRVIAEDIRAPENVPKARTSVKDGYAVIAADNLMIRRVAGVATAGQPWDGILQPGECIRISTGAVIPEGADAVVQVEDTTLAGYDGDVEVAINILIAPEVGKDIREKGSDIKENDVLLENGCELGPAEIGLLHMFGIQNIEIYRKPKVCVMSTGNELVESYHICPPQGFIRDSNRPQLLSLFRSQGFKPIDAGIASDNIDSIEAAIRQASEFASVIVTSGGVSMGEKDYLKEVLRNRLGFEISFGRVWMKPGLPCTVAHGKINNLPVVVFALPGNPVSSYVCANLFVTPFLRAMAGCNRPKQPVIKVKLAAEMRLGPRPEYCRAWLESRCGETFPIANVTGNQISSRLPSLVGAHVLLVIPQSSTEKTQLEKGELVDAIIISSLF